MRKFIFIVLITMLACIYFTWITGYNTQDMNTLKFWIQAVLYFVIINGYSYIIDHIEDK